MEKLQSFIFHDWRLNQQKARTPLLEDKSQASLVLELLHVVLRIGESREHWGIHIKSTGSRIEEPVLESCSWLRNWNLNHLQDVDALFPFIKAGWSVFLTDVQGIHLKTGSLLSRYALPLDHRCHWTISAPAVTFFLLLGHAGLKFSYESF